MVNWKQAESADRLCAALVVAHPSLKLDYNAIAAYFGQGATYDAIQNRFRKVHTFADQLRQEAIERGITDIPVAKTRKSTTGSIASPAPRTPRMGRNGIQKPVSSSSSRRRPTPRTPANFITPTRSGTGSSKAGQSIMDAISLEDDMLDDEKTDLKPTLKAESRSAQISTTAGPASDESDVEIIEMPPSPPAITTGKAEDFYVSTSSFPSYPSFSVSNVISSTVKQEQKQTGVSSESGRRLNDTNTTSSTSSVFGNSRSNNDASLGLSSIGGFAHSSSSAYEMDDPWAEVA
ncbi:uncharacterized protein BO88DRAFT_418553 [Aspergillus vadensis CBS 113365]|uniref:Uncharacterized protein n=1 Tax=Aspergillus vadensis (strain CBS 113365 / IMI 142717 / IBT 24658) TaxID=1448311 RepID=A0A319B127_ASPVC|nr:hypothetical protein BO88DRAFT_418553 [Aspergillus vadensis CBS 113365]PYH65441.1 hypothetical protein BO88DRAFT_418553 [Aspergillus vadensis CBS 113365]